MGRERGAPRRGRANRAQAGVGAAGAGYGDGRTVISLADNGSGLPEKIDQLFAPFFSAKARGSGIGLSLVRQIVLAHGGLATARANPRGAVFSLILS